MHRPQHQKQLTWSNIFLSCLNQQFRLRKFFTPARKAELNGRLTNQDKLQVATPLYISTFFLFNFSIASVYISLKKNAISAAVKIPLILLTFSLMAYKMGLQWINRQFMRQIEIKSTDVAYFFRKQMMVDFKDNALIASRASKLIGKNKQYEQLYII